MATRNFGAVGWRWGCGFGFVAPWRQLVRGVDSLRGVPGTASSTGVLAWMLSERARLARAFSLGLGRWQVQ